LGTGGKKGAHKLNGVQIDIYIQADSSLNSVGGGVENVALFLSVGFILSAVGYISYLP